VILVLIKEHAVILVLLMVFAISVAMAIGFILGRIWQIRCDLEEQRAVGFTVPPIARIPHS
jgi:ABC-type proline/glycine betaine transport system permease subunit